MNQHLVVYLRNHAVLLLLALLLLGGCTFGRVSEVFRPVEPGLPPAAQLAQAPGGNLMLTLGAQDPPSLDPALIGDTTSAFLARQLFSGLVRLDENLEVQPDLAETWDISDSGTVYTFTLRADARFADGRAITSEDVRYSLERATDPEIAASPPAATYLSDIVGVAEKLAGTADTISGLAVPDEQTVVLTIDQPKSYVLAKLAHPTSFIVDQQTVEGGGNPWTERPNGSGPFEIEDWQHNELLVLRRNVNFYREPARLDRVTFLMGAAAVNPMLLYEDGRIDVTSVSASSLARVQDTNNLLSRELISVPQLSLSYIGMNVTLPPFDDPNVRRAFKLLVDQNRIAEVSLQDSAIAARGILPPGMPGYNADLPEPVVDIEQARQLLAESHYGSAEQLPPIAAYGNGWTGLLADVAEEELGITIEQRNYQRFGDYLQALDQNAFPLFGLAWVADYPDPENFVDLLFRTGSNENHTSYSNPAVDALLDQAAIEPDETRRWQLYQEAEQLILADAPIIPISHDVEHLLVKPYVEGLVLTPMGILDLSTVSLIP
ncbi:MAG: peptide ABC transporter substrate-binding protein [Chloroflexaceae bacterium]|nr:peptide ABC transporter substrate-binding protein [Chloroflexaceae bacterium]